MARADFLRKNAEDCFARAQQAPNDDARAMWLGMAEHWMELAQDAERAHAPEYRQPRPLKDTGA